MRALAAAALAAALGGSPASAFAAAPPAAPAASPTAPAASASPAAARIPVLYSVREGAAVDLGWTGIAHGQPWPAAQRLGFELVCPAGRATCAVEGGEPGAIFGAPVAISAGGIPVCVASRLRAPLAGSVDVESGCGEIRLDLTTAVFMGAELARPCPVCRGDGTAHDGRKDGRCDGGAAPGAPCDAESAKARFGATSNDCPPAGTSVGELAIDLLPLTTGTLRVEAGTDCKRKRPGLHDACFCAGQPQPNDCDSGACGPREVCEEGPVDGVCSRAPYLTCRPGSGDTECEAAFKGAGVCGIRTRPCFGDAIVASGTCSPTRPTYVAVLCAPATRAPAVNSAAGLPGPARLVLPLARVEPKRTKPRAGTIPSR